MTRPDRPDTIEEWYPDALAFLRTRYWFLSEIDREEVEGVFTLAVCTQRFVPKGGRSTWVWLCYRVRWAFEKWAAKRHRSHDALPRASVRFHARMGRY